MTIIQNEATAIIKSDFLSAEEKGKIGEFDLNVWFQKYGLSYLHLNQSKETFASLFAGNLKRPDFLVLFESIGLLAVDAKNYTLSGGVYTLELENEVRRVITFERLFRIPVWYAYRREKDGEITWYWISALKAIEVGEVRKNESKGIEFLAIKLEHFVEIRTNEDLGKLFTMRMPSLVSVKSF
jgi:hypothetical protein